MPKLIDPNESGFFYAAGPRELRLLMDVSLVFDPVSETFKIDKSPYQEPDLYGINGVWVAPDHSAMKFEVEDDGETIEFDISSSQACDRVLIQAFQTIRNNGFAFESDDSDDVAMSFEHGTIRSVEIRNRVEDRHVHLFFDDGVGYRIQGSPYSRQPIGSLHIADGMLSYTACEASHVHEIRAQPVIVTVLKHLLDAGLTR